MGRYLVGIDLGTTHTVVAYADLEAGGSPRIFDIEQLVAPGEVAALPLFPSLRYHPAPGELAEQDVLLPWPEPDLGFRTPSAVMGELAREIGSRVPGRLVTSAKSWLSHRLVDRTEPILPWGAAEDVPKISPLHASAGFLAHVRAAWNHRFSDNPLHEQEVVLTVPASFDEAARALTLEAARIAGLVGVRLVEEPQAACYDWLSRNRNVLERELMDIRLLLVCDVGGGTTDFTLIKAVPGPESPQLTRIAVGDHLMLGGDNMDLALAHLAEGRIVTSGAKLSAAGLSQLIQQCRAAKERLLSPDAPDRATVTVLGAGARLIGAARSTELSRSEVQEILVEGFFPRAASDDRPQRVRGGIVEFGLPYVADPAVTRHIAAFLGRYAEASREAFGKGTAGGSELPVPDAVLLNGGVFRSEVLRSRILEVLQSWRGAGIDELMNENPHLAVARGAVAYGLARRGRGLRIAAGSARSYFLILGTGKEEKDGEQGVCILPRGAEEGREIRLEDRTFLLRLGQPVRFHLVSSTGVRNFQPGDLVDVDREEDFTQLPPIATVLPEEAGVAEIPVHLAAVLTEVGTLQMSCVAVDESSRRWNLEFQVRGGGKAAVAMSGDLHPRFGEAAERIELIFGARSQKVGPREVKALRRDLEGILGERGEWDMPLLREMFGALWDGVKHRRRSPDHERIWFHLAGWCLRPGYGYPLDDWRVQQLWTIHDQGVQYVREARVWSEWWTLWRRVAGGLDRHAQERLVEEISFDLLPPAAKRKRPPGPQKQGYDDMVRLVGGLERPAVGVKVEVGEWLLERLKKPAESIQTWWAVGRLGARVPFYGSANNVVSPDVAGRWLERALAPDWKRVRPAAFAATLMARVSGDRQRDVDSALRLRVAEQLRAANLSPTWIRMVEEVAELDEADEQYIFGESLPPGLRLVH